MARIKFFEDNNIVIYIYGEKYGKHHEKHLLVLKADEECQYGFDGKPMKDSKALRNKNDRIKVENWILSHKAQIEKAWEEINSGRKPELIED